jgi:hypothetical protein
LIAARGVTRSVRSLGVVDGGDAIFVCGLFG